MIFNTTGVENPLKYIKDGPNQSIIEGSVLNNKAEGLYSHAEGLMTTAASYYSHAQGTGTEASGMSAHAEGNGSVASGKYSHAEGWQTTASSTYSHAEGWQTIASGQGSHTEGKDTKASGNYAHAEGNATTAYGISSHAGGQYTNATKDSQTVIGKYNELDGNDDSTDAAFIIGGGTSATRKDIFDVNWDGKIIKSPDAWHNYIQIPANSDFNDYVTFGKYAVTSNNDAATMTNSPSTVSGYLYVLPQGKAANTEHLVGYGTETWLYTVQIYIEFGGNGVYIRNGSTGSTASSTVSDISWGSWTSLGTINSVTKAGLVPAPTSSKPYYMYATNANGEPNWYGQQNVLSRTLMLGDASNFSKDFLNIGTTSQFESQKRRAYFTYNDDTKSTFSNIPTQLNLETGYVSGFREVYWITSADVIVKVTESWPVRGRVHWNRYNGSTWNGWRCSSYDFLETRQLAGVSYNDTTRIIVAPLFTAANLGLETSASDSDFYQAWLKKICEIYPNRASYTFVAHATPNSRRMVMCFIYNTSTVNSTTGLPEASFGVSFSYSAYNYLCGRFGTNSYSYYYSSYYKPESTVTASETIGTDGTTAASSTSTWMQKGSKTFGAGTWIIKFTGQWATNSTGYRYIKISETNSTSSPGGLTAEELTQIATPGASTIMTVTAIRKFTANTTLYFYMRQNSGSSLATWGRLQYARLTNM